jgi:hypothetical protein
MGQGSFISVLKLAKGLVSGNVAGCGDSFFKGFFKLTKRKKNATNRHSEVYEFEAEIVRQVHYNI